MDRGLDDSLGLLARAFSSLGGSDDETGIATGADKANGLREDDKGGAGDGLTAARSSPWDFSICFRRPRIWSMSAGAGAAAAAADDPLVAMAKKEAESKNVHAREDDRRGVTTGWAEGLHGEGRSDVGVEREGTRRARKRRGTRERRKARGTKSGQGRNVAQPILVRDNYDGRRREAPAGAHCEDEGGKQGRDKEIADGGPFEAEAGDSG